MVVIVAAYLSVYSVRTTSIPTVFEESREFLLTTVVVSLACLYFSGAYHRIWARTSGHDVAVLVKAVVLSTLILLSFDIQFDPRPMPLSVVLVGNLLALMGLVTIRYRSRVISGLSWRWKAIWRYEFPENETRVLIVGAGEAGQTTAWRLKHRFHDGRNGYRIIGFVDDDPAKQRLYVEGCPVIGTRSDIRELVEKHKIDMIIVAIHRITGPDLRHILTQCEQTEACIKIVPDVFALIQDKKGTPMLRDIQPEDLLGRPAISWYEGIDNAPVYGKTIMVTGAAGSIGSELCRQLVQYRPTKLILLDNNESGLHDLLMELQTNHPDENLVPALVDITDRKAITKAFNLFKPQVVFHSAAYKHVPMLQFFPYEAVRVNVGGTLNLAELACEHKVERFVLISTDKAVDPSSVMGASKRICEQIVHEQSRQCKNNTLFTTVRFGNVLGSRGSVVPLFTRQIDSGGPVTVTDKDMTRFFMTIPEAVNLVIHAACLTTGDTLYMLQMGEDVRIVELAERMIRLRGLRPYTDILINFTGVRPGEKLHEVLHTDDEKMQPTLHPGIVQLVTYRNGFQGAEFWERVRALLAEGFDESRDPLAQLLEVVAVWEREHAYH
jgi:FlaA1/EpsC-like NDP-sugar epimerase